MLLVVNRSTNLIGRRRGRQRAASRVPSPPNDSTINAKITAQQNAETQSINNQTNIDKAEAEAKVKLTQAQADADAKMIQAEAEAKANELLQESLTDKILRQEYIDKWNGELPNIMTGDNSTSLMIPAETE